MTGPSGARRHAGLGVVALCFAVIVLDGYDLVVYSTTLPVMLRDPAWGIGAAQAGVIGSSALVGMLVGALVVGVLTDRLGRRRVLLGTTVWFSVATALCAVAPNAEIFGVLRLLCGVGLGGMLPTAIALTAEYAPRHRRQLYNSIVHVGYSTGGVVAALVAIPGIPALGVRAMYLLGALPLVVLFPLAYRYLPESPAYLVARGRVSEARALAERHGLDPDDVIDRELTAGTGAGPTGATPESGGLRRAVATLFGRDYRRRSTVFALVGFCGLLLTYGVGTWLPELMRQSGFALGSALSFLLVLNLGNVVGSLLVARLADRVGVRRVVPVAFAVGAVALVVMALAPPAAVLYVLVALVGFGAMGAQILVNGFVAASYPGPIRATALGWVVAFSRLGGIAGPAAAGLLVASSLGVAWNFGFFAVVGLAAVVLLAVIGPTDTGRTSADAEGRDRTDRLTPTPEGPR